MRERTLTRVLEPCTRAVLRASPCCSVAHCRHCAHRTRPVYCVRARAEYHRHARTNWRGPVYNAGPAFVRAVTTRRTFRWVCARDPRGSRSHVLAALAARDRQLSHRRPCERLPNKESGEKKKNDTTFFFVIFFCSYFVSLRPLGLIWRGLQATRGVRASRVAVFIQPRWCTRRFGYLSIVIIDLVNYCSRDFCSQRLCVLFFVLNALPCLPPPLPLPRAAELCPQRELRAPYQRNRITLLFYLLIFSFFARNICTRWMKDKSRERGKDVGASFSRVGGGGEEMNDIKKARGYN